MYSYEKVVLIFRAHIVVDITFVQITSYWIFLSVTVNSAKNVYGFCNGPVCPQSPSAYRAMVREGFPATKIYYYRGGMLDWDALGLTTVKGEF